MLNPNTTAQITALIAAEARAVAGSTAAITTLSPRWGTPSIETHVDAALATVAMLDLLAEVGTRDGVLIAAFSDPGLAAVREVADVPVVGIGEAALEAAAESGPFAVLTVQPASVALIEPMVRALGLGSDCVLIHALDVSVLDAAAPDRIREHAVAAGQELAAKTGARSLCLGGGPLGVHADVLAERIGIPVISPVAAGVCRLAGQVRRHPRGNRQPAYKLINHKQLTGDLPFLTAIDNLLWPPVDA